MGKSGIFWRNFGAPRDDPGIFQLLLCQNSWILPQTGKWEHVLGIRWGKLGINPLKFGKWERIPGFKKMGINQIKFGKRGARPGN